MEFHENRARRPFIGFVLLWKFWKAWYRQHQSRKALDRMSDSQLKDVGLNRDDYR
ncbi:DUF1127 domain-containing protein [Shimwellia pseudoproteus]|uniref:DUF1127 domain-containing protein n=1 Tax=Shimwellia pseudoproteus TaxID=570012 RepID=UPI0018ECEF22|nr:DUF1127 domain-containing protein [Shimwellia pseudoproteus]MBJ3814262.1 DUF1127 domain-containing protein [Shimwellia pseudoproteus]